MKPGTKPLPAEVKQACGTDRAGREIASAFPDAPFIEPVMPKWLSARARQVWIKKCEAHARRGQRVAGCEDALAHYCELEAELIAIWQRKQTPMAAMLTQYRLFASEF